MLFLKPATTYEIKERQGRFVQLKKNKVDLSKNNQIL